MKGNLFFTLLFITSCLLSCGSDDTYKNKLDVHYENVEPQELTIKKYNEDLFSIDTANFTEGLNSIKEDYAIFLGDNIDENAVPYLKNFVTDTLCIRINDMVERKFADDNQLKKDIKSVYQHLHYYYPDIMIPDTYFYVSGIDYDMPPVMLQADGVLISMDYYLDNENNIYDYIGMQRYLSLRCQPSYITRDIAQAFYDSYFTQYYKKKDVLSEMIVAGKQLYFIEAMNPALPDSVLLGYSSRQAQWVEQYESDVWAAIVGNDMLYSNEVQMFRTLFNDGPFTQAFSREAPARLGEYIGLQIIRSYMTNNDVSLQELMKNDDVQQIFQDSRYKPKI